MNQPAMFDTAAPAAPLDPERHLTAAERHNKSIMAPLPPRKVHEYDVDPGRIVRSIRKVLETGSMEHLTAQARQFLMSHMGFIAHYDMSGFRAEYADRLGLFALNLSRGGEGERDGHLVRYWIEDQESHLHASLYRGRVAADIVREVVDLAEHHRERLAEHQRIQQRQSAAETIQRLAVAHGITSERLAELLAKG